MRKVASRLGLTNGKEVTHIYAGEGHNLPRALDSIVSEAEG